MARLILEMVYKLSHKACFAVYLALFADECIARSKILYTASRFPTNSP